MRKEKMENMIVMVSAPMSSRIGRPTADTCSSRHHSDITSTYVGGVGVGRSVRGRGAGGEGYGWEGCGRGSGVHGRRGHRAVRLSGAARPFV